MGGHQSDCTMYSTAFRQATCQQQGRQPERPGSRADLECWARVNGVHKDRVVAPALHILLRSIEGGIAREAAAKVILDSVIH